MHEVGIITELLRSATRELERAGCADRRVTRLQLRIGPFSTASAEALQFSFELLSKDTPFEGAVLQIDQSPFVCVCTACDARYESDEPWRPCRACASPDVRIEGGDELRLESLEVED